MTNSNRVSRIKTATPSTISATSPTTPPLLSPYPANASNQSSAPASSNKSIVAIFEKYQKERLLFAQTVADQAMRESNVDSLLQSGVMSLLKPLLSDPFPAIQHSAAVAVGRLAKTNEAVATAVVKSDILPQLILSLREKNRYYKKAASFVVRSIVRHSAELAQVVVDSGAVPALAHCLEEFDPTVKESACWAIGYIARHSADLAQAVVNAGCIPLLLLCLQEPEVSLKKIAASSLADISKHTPDLAQAVVDAHSIPVLASFINTAAKQRDQKLTKQAVSCLAQIAKHTLFLAEAVVDGDIFPHIYQLFKGGEPGLRRCCAELVGEVVKHSAALSQLVVQTGGIAVTVDYLNEVPNGSAKVPALMILGYLASISEVLAMSVIVGNGVLPLINALSTGASFLSSESENGGADYSQSAACWALGQIGRYSPEHAKHLVNKAVLPRLLAIFQQSSSSHQDVVDLRKKSKRALKAIIGNTLDVSSLDPLLQGATPAPVLKYILAQCAKVLPNDVEARKFMVTSGALARCQIINATQAKLNEAVEGSPVLEEGDSWTESNISESIRQINSCFPEEIVRFYSAAYSSSLLSKIEDYRVSPAQTTGASAPVAASS